MSTRDAFVDDRQRNHTMSSYAFLTDGAVHVIVKDVLVVVAKTPRGWRSRSVVRDRLNHDYVSHETLFNVLEWMRDDESCRPQILSDRSEAMEHLCSTKTGFLLGDPSWSSVERAEAVLQHLERGW